MAQVADLQANSAVDTITIKIIEKGEARDVRGGTLRVCDCKASDSSGEITLTLWNDDINKVNKDDMVTITKGWVSEYQGDKKLSSGKYGELTVEKGEAAPADAPSEDVLEAMDDEII